jgi:Domain of unknown function (DUF4276)
VSVEHLEILVEEPSMEAALRAFLPIVTGDVTFEVYPHQCKSELLQRLPERIRGYAPWLPPSWRILILVDRDDDECVTLKKTLDDAVENAGLRTRSKAQGKSWQVVNRLAIEELEAWYFGDWHAVRQAYPRVPDTIPAKKKFRNPDAIRGGTWEAFERILQSSGYFRGGLRKIEAARNIGAHFQAARNTSQSFQAFCSVVAELLAPA